LVGIRQGVLVDRVRSGAFPASPENQELNGLLSRLQPGDREIVARLVEKARDGGIHDALSFIEDLLNIEGYDLTHDGESVPRKQFAEMRYDWVCRSEGDPWPDEKGNT
jgi:hypothetical protein